MPVVSASNTDEGALPPRLEGMKASFCGAPRALPCCRRRLRTHAPVRLRAPVPASPPPDAPQPDAPLVCRRSKLILTRRIFAWTLRKRQRAASPTLQDRPAPPLARIVNALEPLPLEAALLRDEPVRTFVFQRGIVSFNSKRRSGDPPCRYLELAYGLVQPFSPAAWTCSNPRASGTLRHWYQAARRWRVLQTNSRPKLVLAASRRRFVDEQAAVAAAVVAADLADEAGGGEVPMEMEGTTEVDMDMGVGVGVPSARREPVRGTSVPLLVESRWERALGRAPRVIVIGDVHGCISELQQLLRLADFQPGDQVVLLGDLVAKGPDSVGVVQLAREIGARSVRGNHDFEVLRWSQAQARGDGEATVSMEHARIARALGKAEHEWLVESPWFIECAEMGYLFVHAGFIPGVKLTQQNPRLMMNMRSVLQDGTVTAKNVADCEWAKLWRGPQTVVFGHDAFRGLQQYEFAKGIDTGCVYGGRLTALLLPENRMISVAAKREYVSPRKFRGFVKTHV